MSRFLQGRQDHAEKQETRNKYTQQMSSSSKYEGTKKKWTMMVNATMQVTQQRLAIVHIKMHIGIQVSYSTGPTF